MQHIDRPNAEARSLCGSLAEHCSTQAARGNKTAALASALWDALIATYNGDGEGLHEALAEVERAYEEAEEEELLRIEREG